MTQDSTQSGKTKGCCLPARISSDETRTQVKSLIATSSCTMSQETVDVPGGPALLGTNSPHLPADGEGPLQRKTVKPFKMDVTAVTNARFAAFVEATGYELSLIHI